VSDASASGADAGDVPIVVSAEVKNGLLTVTFDRKVYGTFVSYCGDAPHLLKFDEVHQSWGPLEDDRGLWCSGEAYFLDGKYFSNSCLGCDGGDPCVATTTLRVDTTEYVQTGTSESPEGVDGGVVPLIVSRPSSGPYHLLLTFRTSPSCSGNHMTAELAVPG
jgi:hypothetical protein